MSSGFDSLRFQHRWSRILLRITWLLTFVAAGIGFYFDTRGEFLLICLPVIVIEMILRDYVLRRVERRRQPPRRKPEEAESSMSATE